MEKGDYIVKNLYQPGVDSFNLESKNLPAHHMGMDGMLKASDMGITVNPMVADQLGELSRALNQGVVPVEVGTLDMKNFDTVPTEHWDEMRRKAELAGSRVTMHAPLIDPAGFNSQGRWDESSQKLAEMQLKDVFDKASQLTSRKTGVATPVTIHAGNYAGSTYKIDENGNKVTDQLIAVNRETGELAPMRESIQYAPEFDSNGKLKKGGMSPEIALRSANQTQWRKEVDEVIFKKESVDNIVKKITPGIKSIYGEVRQRVKVDPTYINKFETNQRREILEMQTADAHLTDAELKVHSVFDKAYQYASDDIKIKDEKGRKVGLTKEEKKEILTASAKRYEDKIERGGYSLKEFNSLNKKRQEEIINNSYSITNQANAIQNLAEEMRIVNPNMFQRVEDFAIGKASKTLTNVALHAYDKSKETGIAAPQVSLENLYSGMAFSQGKDVAAMAQKTRDEFALKLIKERNVSRKEAEKIASDMVGVTFDVGHLNMSRQHGFKEENLVKEAEALKNYVNKVHLTDNFGYEDVHLPVGMGNVPVKQLLKAIGKKGEESVKINEVGGWINAFKTSPFPQLLQAAGSPIYGTGSGPTWAQNSGFQQSYSSGFGQMLPDTHYGLFGAGFSQLPVELGGSVQGSRGRD